MKETVVLIRVKFYDDSLRNPFCDWKTDKLFPLELFKNAPDYKEEEFYEHREQVARNSGCFEIKGEKCRFKKRGLL